MSTPKKQRPKEIARAKRREEKRQAQQEQTPPVASNFTDGHAVPTVSDDRELSDAFTQVLEPLVAKARTEGGMQAFVRLGIIAWNCSLNPKVSWQTVLKPHLLEMPEEARENIAKTILALMVRKLQLYPTLNRFILAAELTMLPTGPYVQVTAALPENFLVPPVE